MDATRASRDASTASGVVSSSLLRVLPLISVGLNLPATDW